MKRRHFFQTSPALALLGSGSLQAESPAETPSPPGPTPALVLTPAVIMAPRQDGAEVVWGVGRLARGWVEWKGADGSSGKAHTTRDGFHPQADKVMKVRLERLQPGAEYQIRAVTEAIDGAAETFTSEWKTFRTLSPTAPSAHFVVWNDTHQQDGTIQQLNQITPAADFLLWNGDTCNDWHKEESLIPTLLHPGGTDFSRNHPVLITMGNHDVRGKYGFRVPDVVASPGQKPYYAFRCGPVAVIALHTGEDKPDDHPSFAGRASFQELREEQARWLQHTILRPELRDAPYRVVFCHIPLRLEQEPESLDYANGDYDHYARSSRVLWHDSLVAWRAQVIISGHIHRQSYLPATEDFPYAQLIGGGPQPEHARLIEGKADQQQLVLTTRNLQNEETHQVRFPPLGS